LYEYENKPLTLRDGYGVTIFVEGKYFKSKEEVRGGRGSSEVSLHRQSAVSVWNWCLVFQRLSLVIVWGGVPYSHKAVICPR
jgi:hypothetical protein